MKTSINLWGACVARAIFSQATNRGEMDYLIRTGFFQLSPLSYLMSDPLPFLDEFKPNSELGVFVSSYQMDIAKKGVLEELKRKKSEWIVVDLISLVSNIFEITYGEKKYYLSCVDEKRYDKKHLDDFLSKYGCASRILNIREQSVLYEEAVKRFCELLVEVYPENRIIVIETLPAKYAVKDDGKIDSVLPVYDGGAATYLENIAEIRKWSRYCYQLLKTTFADAHYIDTLDPIISGYKQPNQIDHYHYAQPYYEYVYKAIGIITDMLEWDEEKKGILELNNTYSILLEQIYDAALMRTIVYDRENALWNSMTLAEQRFFNESAESTYLQKKRSYYMIDKAFKTPYFHGEEALFEIKNFNEYIGAIIELKQPYILFGAVADSANRYWNRFEYREQFNLTSDMLFRESYIFLYDFETKKSVELRKGNADLLRFHCELGLNDRSFIGSSDMRTVNSIVDIQSKAYERSAEERTNHYWASIYINNIDYSLNKTGLNCVVFGKEEGCVVDSFYVNFWNDANLTIRRL